MPAVKLCERLRRAGCTKPACGDGRREGPGPPLSAGSPLPPQRRGGGWRGPACLGAAGKGRAPGRRRPAAPHPSPLRGVSVPSGAGGGRAASPPSLISRGRPLKGQSKRSGTKASGDVPGPRPPGGGGESPAAGRRGPLPGGGVRRSPWESETRRGAAWTRLKPEPPAAAPAGRSPGRPRSRGAASGRAPRASPPSHPQPREESSARGALAARQLPPGVHGFRGPRAPTLARGPRRAARGGAARQGAGGKSPGGSPEVLPPPPGGSCPSKPGPPKEAGLELRPGSPLRDF